MGDPKLAYECPECGVVTKKGTLDHMERVSVTEPQCPECSNKFSKSRWDMTTKV